MKRWAFRGATAKREDDRELSLWEILCEWWRNVLALLRNTRRVRRVRRRLPIYSHKAAAKKRAHRYAKEVTGRDVSWKRARKLLNRWDREGRQQNAAEKVAS